MRAKSRSKRLVLEKPIKPKNCPLTPSGGGSWVKKIRGRLYSFGPWHDLEGALKRYYSQIDFILANGFQPSESDASELTIEELANRFLERQDERASLSDEDDDAISIRHYNDLHESCTIFVETVGKRKIVDSLIPRDYAKVKRVYSKKSNGKTSAPATIAGHVRRARAMFNWAYAELLTDKPPRYGKNFRVPSKRTFRRHKNKQPDKIFTPEEIHGMIRLAPVSMKAAIWLGINCGLNNSDVGELLQDVYLNRQHNWMFYPRNKTCVFRKLPLWPQTVVAIENMIAIRSEPNSAEVQKHLFLTRYGNRFGDTTISTEIQKLKKKLSIVRRGCGFNALRHCIETFGGKDQVAINILMGHVDPHISADYRSRIRFPNDRLIKVTSEIRDWLGVPTQFCDQGVANE